jgi:hypothetical protein
MADGRVHVEAFITRAGIFEYLNNDGSVRRELRTPEEVFDQISMRSFQLIPVTNEHPPGLLNTTIAKKYMVGMTGESVTRDDERIRTSLMVTDADTIAAMDAGKLQVSCGYNCRIDSTPGVHPIYGKYDVQQKDIRGNHVAIVDKGRAGDAALRMDSEVAVMHDALAVPKSFDRLGVTNMENKDMMEAAAAQFATATARADAAETALSAEKSRADAAEGTVAMLKAQLESAAAGPKPADIEQRDAQIHNLTKLVAAEKVRADKAESPDTIRALVKQRVALETAAAAVMGSTRLDTFNDRELMDLVIEKLLGKVVEKERSDDYVRACFDTAINGYFGSKDALSKLREAVQPKDVQPRVDAASARQAMIERNYNASKVRQENK